jgi:hypothetical protein
MRKNLILIFLLAFLSSKSQNNAELEKAILGKWKYNIAYDGVAEIDTADFYKPFEEREKKYFFTEIKIKKNSSKLSDYLEKYNATWAIKNSNELCFFLEDKTILKYIIIKLTADTLELREPKSKISTLRYNK